MVMTYKNISINFFLILLTLILSNCGKKGDIKRNFDSNQTIIPASIDYKKAYKY